MIAPLDDMCQGHGRRGGRRGGADAAGRIECSWDGSSPSAWGWWWRPSPFVVGATYNGLVRARNGYQNAFAQIDVQLTRRHDLIPNLVETAKGYIKHERETLEAVVAARAAAVTAQSARERPAR